MTKYIYLNSYISNII